MPPNESGFVIYGTYLGWSKLCKSALIGDLDQSTFEPSSNQNPQTMKVFWMICCLLVASISFVHVQSNNTELAKKPKAKIDGLRISTAEDDMKGLLEMAAKFDQLAPKTRCTVALSSAPDSSSTKKIKVVRVEIEGRSCTEAAKAAQKSLQDMKARVTK